MQAPMPYKGLGRPQHTAVPMYSEPLPYGASSRDVYSSSGFAHRRVTDIPPVVSRGNTISMV